MEPRARIEAFLADYAAAHAEVLPLMEVRDEDSRSVIFEVWGRKLHELDVAHKAGEPFSRRAGSARRPSRSNGLTSTAPAPGPGSHDRPVSVWAVPSSR